MEECTSPASASTAPSKSATPKLSMTAKSDRYQRTGYGSIIARVLGFSFVAIYPQFLKMVWPFFMNMFTPFQFELFVFWVIPPVTAIWIHIGMYFVYTLKIPFLERYRLEPNKPWPWEAHPETWPKLLRKAVINIAFKDLFYSPLFFYVLTKYSTRFDQSLETFPGPLEIAYQLFLFMMVSDTTFYFVHRVLHHPKLYKHCHKLHHEYIGKVAIGSLNLHPLDFFLTNFIPFVMSYIFLKNYVHLATISLWIMLMPFFDISNHNGYDFSFNPLMCIPFSEGDDYHYFHHTHNTGNYADFFPFWDNVFGTNSNYKKFIKEQKEE